MPGHGIQRSFLHAIAILTIVILPRIARADGGAPPPLPAPGLSTPTAFVRETAFDREVKRGFSHNARIVRETPERDAMVLLGDVRFESNGGRIELLADAVVVLGDFRDASPAHFLDAASATAIYAEGNVLLGAFGDSLEADWLYLDLVTGEGGLERSGVGRAEGIAIRSKGGLERAIADPGAGQRAGFSFLLKASRAHVTLEDGIRSVDAEDAVLSTCTYGEPHWGIRARDVRVIPREREGDIDRTRLELGGGVAAPVPGEARIEVDRPALEIMSTPVLPYPSGVFWDTAWNPFVPRVHVGSSHRFGAFSQLVMPVRPADGVEVQGKLDVLTRRGVGTGGLVTFEGPSGDRATYTGFFDGYYISDRSDKDLSSGLDVPQRDRGRIHGFARDDWWPFSATPAADAPAVFRREVEVSYISDRAFLKEYYEPELRNGKEQETVAYGRWLKDDMGATLEGRWRLNPFQTQTEYLPRGRWSWIGEPFFDSVLPGGRGIYLTTAWELENARIRPDEATLLPSDRLLRADLDDRLDYPFPVGPVEIDPFALGRYSAWSERFPDPVSTSPFLPERGERPAIDRFVLGAGAIATTDVWRDFGAVRHIATPYAGYTNVPYVDRDPSALVPLDATEAVMAEEFIPFGIRNRFQVPRGESAAAVDFVDWNVGSRFFPHPVENGGDRFGPLTSDLRLNPLDFVSGRWLSQWDLGAHPGLFRSDLEIMARPDPLVAIGGSFRYLEDQYKAVDLLLELRPVERYGFLLSSQYDFQQRSFTDQRVAIRRYFHRFVLEVQLDHDLSLGETRFAATFVPIELFNNRSPFGSNVQPEVNPMF